MNSNRTRPSLNQIAALLGVSSATVSNALSGKGRVSTELAEKIQSMAADLGYTPSTAGRALRTGRSQALGLVLPDIANPLFPQIAQAIENAAAKAGYGVLIADARGEVAMQTDAINRLLERGVDGIVIVPRRGTRIADIGSPVAVIDSPSTPGNTVSADHWQGGHLMGQHLASLGHRKLLLIGKNPDSNVQNDRIGGLKSGIPKDCITEVLWIEKRERLLGAGCPLGLEEKLREGFTAFAAVSDLHALRALTELQRAGIRVPEEASVTGFDDLVWSSVISPALTTMQMDMPSIAEFAIQVLVDAINAEPGTAATPTDTTLQSRRVPMSLIIRQTSASPTDPTKTSYTPEGEPR